MASTVKNKRSTTSGNSPTLTEGEIALQLADKRIITANSSASFDAFQNTVSNIAITNTSGQLSVGNTTVKSTVNSTGFSLTVNSTTTFTISAPSASDYASGAKVLLSNGSFGSASGGGTPGGSNTNIQFNDSNTFNGTNNFNYDKSSNTLSFSGSFVANADFITIGNTTINSTINSISLNLPVGPSGANAQAAPNSGMLLYDKYKANRFFPHVIDSNGWDASLDCHPIHSSVYFIMPTVAATTLTTMRTAATIAGSTVNNVAATPNLSNLYLSQARLIITANATAGANSTLFTSNVSFSRGNAANVGGFYAAFKFGLEKAVTNTIFYVGFADVTAGVNANPSGIRNIIGFGKDRGQTNLYAISANSSATVNTDLSGMDFTVNQTNWYEGIIYALPNGGNVYYQLTNITTGAIANGQFAAANLPANNQLLCWKISVSKIVQTANTDVAFGGVQIEVPN